MPEGHVVHRLAREVRERFAGDSVRVSSPQGRFEAGARLIDRRPLSDAEAYGKHLLLGFGSAGDERWVHVHLGIYGRLTLGELPAPPVRGQVRMRLEGTGAWADLRGAAACEVLEDGSRAALVARIGPDPLRDDADPERAWARIHASRTTIATLLMDQSVISGVGNIYRAEVLFRHGLDPLLPGRALPRDTWEAMWTDLVALMHDGVLTGRIDTVRPEDDPAVTGREPRQDRHGGEVYVYRRAGQPCHVCGTVVATRDLGGRNLFWCPTCQPAGHRS